MSFDTWACHICKRERPDAAISVHTTSVVLPNGGTVEQNVRYCNDNPDCVEKAKTFSFFKKETA